MEGSRDYGWAVVRRLVHLLTVLALTAGVASAGAVASSASEPTPGLAEARAEAQRLVDDIGAAESRLGELTQEIDRVEAERAEAAAELEGLRLEVQEVAIDQYTRGGLEPIVDGDPNRQARASALARVVTQDDVEAIDRYRQVQARLDASTEELEAALAEQQDVISQLESRQEELDAELARLEELERRRIEEERRRAEEAAQRAREAADREAAQERADQLARQEAAMDAGQEAATSPGGTVEDTPSGPVVDPPSGGGIVCPAPGSVFRDGWGDPRSGGRSHGGVDMMAPTGTPVLAPVSGTVSHGSDTLGGMNFTMTGDDGRFYYGAHLSGFGQGGHVAAGTVIGYVGETGNAVGSHLHFEIHVGGVRVNPYPYVAAAC